MDNFLLPLELIAFTSAWWLGLYLLGRDRRNLKLSFTGIGLLTYALALGFDMLRFLALEPEVKQALGRWGWPLLFLPALFWVGTLIFLLPPESQLRQRLAPAVKKGLLPFALLLYLAMVAAQVFETNPAGEIVKSPVYAIFAAVVALLLMTIFLLLIRTTRGQQQPSSASLVMIATLFFGLGLGLLLLPLNLIPDWLLVLGIGFDLVLLGFGIALSDAFDKGEALMPDFLRSLAYSFFVVLLFGSQIALAMAWGTGVTFTMVLLLLAVIMTAVVTQTFVDPIQAGLDWLIFSHLPWIRQVRADARVISSSAPRTRAVFDPEKVNEEQFARLTRQALSNMGNLPRLSASPLTRLNLVEKRLSQRAVADNTLERAAELKKVLSESINRLKPRDGVAFGTNDAWRYFNALYYPYVVGLKPYSRRAEYHDLDPVTLSTLAWFQSQVPERTLYNWQNAAAKLIAQDIREQTNGFTQNQ